MEQPPSPTNNPEPLPNGGPTWNVAQITATVQSGPLPPVEYFREIESVQAGLAERVIQFAEREQLQRHRQASRELELIELQITSQNNSTARGTYVGGTVVAIALFVALALGLHGEGIVSGVIGGLDLVALAAVFTARKANESVPVDAPQRLESPPVPDEAAAP
jgi:uncharacterized membrane protein